MAGQGSSAWTCMRRSTPTVPAVDRPVSVLKTGFRFSEGGPQANATPPRLGEHTDEILGELGYSQAEIATLREADAI